MGKRIVITALFGLFFSGFISLSPLTSQTARAGSAAPDPHACIDSSGDSIEKPILTIQPWYHNLCESTDHVVMKDLTYFLPHLALNLLSIALQIGGYVAVGFVIWGGMKYIIAAGEPGKLAKAKTTIQNALIGLLIVLASVAIVTFVRDTLLSTP